MRRRGSGDGTSGRSAGRALLIDQLVEPAHLALRGFEPELVELGGVPIQPFGGPGDGRAQSFPPFLDPPSAALEDAHPRVGVRPGEERQMHAKPWSDQDCGPASPSSAASRSLPSPVIRYTTRDRREDSGTASTSTTGSSVTMWPTVCSRRRVG